MLRLWLSHGQLPPVGRVLGCLSRLCGCLGGGWLSQGDCSKDSQPISELEIGIIVRKKSVPSSQFSKRVCALVASFSRLLFMREKSLEEVCEELNHDSLAACKSERKHTRPMELMDFLKFIQRQAKDTLTGLDGRLQRAFSQTPYNLPQPPVSP